jgi:hypothetical protein
MPYQSPTFALPSTSRTVCVLMMVRIKRVATQTHVAGFAFKAGHEGRVDRLPVVAERAAANETAAQVGVPRVSRYSRAATALPE